MTPLLVVADPKRVDLDLPGVEVVRARDYLTDERFAERRQARVFNLCRTSSYQSVGYYVSLLADGRGHRPIPSVATLQDLRSEQLTRAMADDVEDIAARALARLRTDEFVLSVYFGRNLSARYDELARALFNRFPAPLLRARFARRGPTWTMSGLRSIGLRDVPDSHRAFITEQAARHFERKSGGPRRRKEGRFDLAILVNPEEVDCPSDEPAIERFVRAGRERSVDVEVIDPADRGRVPEFDALFLRETTYVNHHTYRMARRAEAEGLVVMDDPTSIVRATNKVFLAEAFRRHRIPHPKTIIVDEDRAALVEQELGFPCVLKRPDSSFSAGVKKANDPAELAERLAAFFEESELVVAQAWTPSAFDWRIGVLGGQPLYACRYMMAPGHWQIQHVDDRGKRHYGDVETIAVEDAPPEAVRVGLRAAKTVGDGLYGVDVKEVIGPRGGRRFLAMEVNDNPNIDHGNEDAVLGMDIYRAVIDWFVTRLEQRGRRTR